MVSSLIFQKFSGEGLTEPPPQTPPPALSRASPLVRASLSILGRFAPSTRAPPSILGRFAPLIRASPLTFDWRPWFGPPQNKFLDPPLVIGYLIGQFFEKWTILGLVSSSWIRDILIMARNITLAPLIYRIKVVLQTFKTMTTNKPEYLPYLLIFQVALRLHYITSHHTTPRHTTPHNTARTPHHNTPHHTTPHHTTQQCTALHCTALHCTALHCTALHCTALHCTTLHNTALHCTDLLGL